MAPYTSHLPPVVEEQILTNAGPFRRAPQRGLRDTDTLGGSRASAGRLARGPCCHTPSTFPDGSRSSAEDRLVVRRRRLRIRGRDPDSHRSEWNVQAWLSTAGPRRSARWLPRGAYMAAQVRTRVSS